MSPTDESRIVKVYVWEVPVRIAHWLIAFSILVLSATGFYIGHPLLMAHGEARQWFVMGWVKVIHGYTAYVFITAVLVRIIWMFTGNTYARWYNFVPVRSHRRYGLWPMLRFYVFALRKPPGFVGHNPLAGITYLAVFGLYGLAIATGLVLRGASAGVDSPLRWVASWAGLFGGLYVARWIHHAVMWMLLGFAVHHVYSSLLMSTIEANATVESIHSGYKFVPEEYLQSPGAASSTPSGQIDG